jgi:hypothetical protein
MHSVGVAVLAFTLHALLGAAPVRSEEARTFEQPSSREEIAQAMQELERKYGKDAVAFEGQLLGQAVRSGSILAAVISVPGVRERDGARFLAFDLDTGIIFNDRDTDAAQRPAEVWTQIVVPSLQQFAALRLPADGVALLISYRHRPYADLSELHAQLRDDPGSTETAAFYVRIADAAELAAKRLTSQQLVDRSTVLVDDTPRRLTVPEPTPVPTAGAGS